MDYSKEKFNARYKNEMPADQKEISDKIQEKSIAELSKELDETFKVEDIMPKQKAKSFTEKGIETKSFEKANRIKIIAQDILFGYNTRTIIANYTKKWGVKENTVRHYCNEARTWIRDEIQTDPEEMKLDIISKYNDLYLANRETGNLSECKKILDSLVKLTQIQVTQVNHNDMHIATIKLTEMYREDMEEIEKETKKENDFFEELNTEDIELEEVE